MFVFWAPGQSVKGRGASEREEYGDEEDWGFAFGIGHRGSSPGLSVAILPYDKQARSEGHSSQYVGDNRDPPWNHVVQYTVELTEAKASQDES